MANMALWLAWNRRIIQDFKLFAEASSDLVPDCQEGEPKEKPQRSTKLCNQGGEGVEQDLFLNLGCMGGRPEGQDRTLGHDFWAAIYKLVLLVMAWPHAPSHL